MDSAEQHAEAVVVRRVAGVLLVDRVGRVLLQHRDSGAPVAPEQWSCPAGGIEDGETPEQAAVRELAEETGLAPEGGLRLFWSGQLDNPWGRVEYHIYCGTTDARQEDVVLGEGQAMVFIAPEDVRRLKLTASSARILPAFLDSDAYRQLTG